MKGPWALTDMESLRWVGRDELLVKRRKMEADSWSTCGLEGRFLISRTQLLSRGPFRVHLVLQAGFPVLLLDLNAF